MDLRQARTFVTVADLGTVSRAAERLRITQPALSRQINNLQQELGLKLFDRVGRRLVLTGEGEQLLVDYRSLLNSVSAIGERAQQLRRGDTGVLRVAGSPQIIESVFSSFLHVFAGRYPDVEVRLIESIGLDTLALLERGEVHLGQHLAHAVQSGEQRFASHPMGSVELMAAYHPSVALGRGKALDIGQLAPYPLLLLDRGFTFRHSFDAACRLAGLEPNIRFESRAPHTLLAMADKGHGVAIIPSALRTQPYRLRIARLTYQGMPLRVPLTILWDKRRRLPPYAAAFCKMFAEHVSEVFPITQPHIPQTNLSMKRDKARQPRKS